MNNTNLINLLKSILPQIKANNGITINHNGNAPHQGYMVSFEGKELQIKNFSLLSLSQKIESIISYLDRYNLNANEFYGFWYETKTDILYCDISENVLYKEIAYNRGKARHQKSIYSITFNKVIYL